jgi:murein DD-endopeptidase MepM/ murein hydrolase activator NlpD
MLKKQPTENKSVAMPNKSLSWWQKWWNSGKRSLTLMIAPHDSGRVFQLRISVFSLWIFSLLTVCLILGVAIFSTGWVITEKKRVQAANVLADAQASMDVIGTSINNIGKNAQILDEMIRQTAPVFGQDSINGHTSSGDLSDTSSIDSVDEHRHDTPELQKLRLINAAITSVIPQISQITGAMEAQRTLLADMPTRRPLGGGIRGYLTQGFGPSRDPFTGEYQFHTGVDLAYMPGAPIIAAANGTVVRADFDATGYGLFVIMRHRYGFYTRYAHMQRYVVGRDQTLKQGDLIGYMGSTGRVTGPHLHFEVMMGTELLNPLQYLEMGGVMSNRYLVSSQVNTKENLR